MKLLPLVFLCVALAACTQAPAPSVPALQCAKDTDCKGERICEQGKCQAPVDLHAATPPVALTPAGAAVSPAAPSAPLPAAPVVSSGNPKFSDYPADVYAGPAGQLDLSNEDARTYKTRLREAMEQAPEFAGEYALMTMGCGSSGCISQMLVSRKTGHVLKRSFGSYSAVAVTDENGEEIRIGETLEGMRPNSRLLVVRNVFDPNEEDDVYQLKAKAEFYLLENGELTLLKTVALPDIVVQDVAMEE